MAILGNIIKGAIHIKETFTIEKNPWKEQQEVLQNLLDTSQNTEFGRHYNFETILNSQDLPSAFAEKIPFFDYNKINDEWWYKLHEGHENVTWPGKPSYFALSSGTTGKSSKRIPVTDETIESIRAAGLKQVFALSNLKIITSRGKKLQKSRIGIKGWNI